MRSRSRHFLPGAGAGALKTFCLEPEPEPKCFPGAGVGAGAVKKIHGSASLVKTTYPPSEFKFLLGILLPHFECNRESKVCYVLRKYPVKIAISGERPLLSFKPHGGRVPPLGSDAHVSHSKAITQILILVAPYKANGICAKTAIFIHT